MAPISFWAMVVYGVMYAINYNIRFYIAEPYMDLL